MKKIPLIFVLVMLLITCSGCGMTLSTEQEESLPEETIEEFEIAVNDLDIQGMLDCMGEDMQSTATSALDFALNIVSAVAGVNISDFVSAEDLINAFPLIKELLPYSDYADIGEVDFQVHTTYIKGDTATVYFTEVNSGEDMVVNMVMEDGKWVFSMTTTLITEEEAERIIIDGVEQPNEK